MFIRLHILLTTFVACFSIATANAVEVKEQSTSAYLANQQCRISPSWLPGLDDIITPSSQGQLTAEADHVELRGNQFAELSGHVTLRQDNQWLITNNAVLDQEAARLHAYNGIRYGDGYIAIRADEIEADMNAATAEVGAAEYLLIPNSAYGTASSIALGAAPGERHVTLSEGTFTTCPGERPAWQIRADSIQVNENKSWGVAKRAQVRLFDVPVLYVPHFTFPLTDERKTGLLYPVVRSTSRNGLEVEVPWYLNLAPQRDATITPRFTSKRGVMLMAELRQLTEQHRIQLNGEYLDGDKEIANRPNRHFIRFETQSEWQANWSSYVEFMQVSDTSYIHDFNSNFANPADAHLYRQGQLNYHGAHSRLQIQVEDFQMLGPYSAPYRTLPRISFHSGRSITDLLSYNVFSELTHFRNSERSQEHATRLHIEPSVSLNVQQPGWDWQTEVSYLATHYTQNNIPDTSESTVTRYLPRFRTQARLHLERAFGDEGGLQTLTPQVQYLYVPFRDQSNIGIYDTGLIQDDYHGLFRARRFTGLDRVADAHQVTLGASTSIFDSDAEELLRVSLGQIFYLDESQTQLFDDSSRITASNSELASELDFRVSDRWFFSGALQYDTTLQIARKARLAAEYRKDSDSLIQFNYRKVHGAGNETEESRFQRVEQIGVASSWRLDQDWALAAHWYQDIRRGTTVDALIGIQYESCCWSIRVNAYRRINRSFEPTLPNSPVPAAEFDNGVSVQFMLTGLGGGSRRLTDILQQSIFGYRRPFYLSN